MMPPKPPPFDEINQIWVAKHFEAASARNEFCVRLAQEGLRSLVLINGGALIGFMSFLGAVPDFITSGIALWWAFGLFAFGLVMAILAIVLAYLAQEQFASTDWASANAVYREVLVVDSGPNRLAQAAASARGILLTRIAIAIALLSLFGFVGGAMSSLIALTS
ncbi:MAG TPA: hypothetical protein VEA80_13180 [Vitreimonas sp.]|uniref:hypothetical protein n=1 Tax=Vitreimonas sp. TaxID=3069702 RepID=UPI002D4C5E10|nr:hypothetical protein [Vitreimonas sp.]HYD88422.1 hypothetical protein [Vitreimonas sp.]